MNNEIIKFVNGDLQLDVAISPDNETVWLSQKQMAELFNKDRRTITRHIIELSMSQLYRLQTMITMFEKISKKNMPMQEYHLYQLMEISIPKMLSSTGILVNGIVSFLLH